MPPEAFSEYIYISLHELKTENFKFWCHEVIVDAQYTHTHTDQHICASTDRQTPDTHTGTHKYTYIGTGVG